jgi:hypothetical protein
LLSLQTYPNSFIFLTLLRVITGGLMKRIDINHVIATTLATLAFAVCAIVPATAAGGGAVGSWSVIDHGPGCWGGGSLFAGGKVGGNGECAFNTGRGAEVATLQPVSWSYTNNNSAVVLNAFIIGQKGPVYPIDTPLPVSVTVPLTGPGAPFPDGQGDYVKVNIF